MSVILQHLPFRWWDQYNLLPWPDSFAIMCVGMFEASGDDVRSRLMRRNMIRRYLYSTTIQAKLI